MQEVTLELVLKEERKVEHCDEMPVGMSGFAVDDALAAGLEELGSYKSSSSEQKDWEKNKIHHSLQRLRQPESQGQREKRMTSS